LIVCLQEAPESRRGRDLNLFLFAAITSVKLLLFAAITLGKRGEEIFALQEERQGEIVEQGHRSLEQGAKEGDKAIEFGDGAVHHGGDDVGIEPFAIEEVGDAKDELIAVEVELEATQSKLLVGSHEEFEG
jgi:hypothetical protein